VTCQWTGCRGQCKRREQTGTSGQSFPCHSARRTVLQPAPHWHGNPTQCRTRTHTAAKHTVGAVKKHKLSVQLLMIRCCLIACQSLNETHSNVKLYGLRISPQNAPNSTDLYPYVLKMFGVTYQTP